MPDPSAQPRYARFSRRLKGIFIDWTITLIVIFGALIIAASLRDDSVSRAIGAIVVVTLVLYEPLLVSRTRHGRPPSHQSARGGRQPRRQRGFS